MKEIKRKDYVLAADYSYFILIAEYMRNNELVMDTLSEILRSPAKALGKYCERRAFKLEGFRQELDRLHLERGIKKKTSGQTDFTPVPKEIFNKVVENYEKQSAKEFAQFIRNPEKDKENDEDDLLAMYLRRMFNCLCHFHEDQWQNQVSVKIKDEALNLFEKLSEGQSLKELWSKNKLDILETNETFQIVNDLIVKADAESLDGKMKIVRVSSIDNGNILYTSLCLARQVISNNNDTYTFEVIRDFGNFKLKDFQKKSDSKLVERNMVYRVRRILQQDKCGYRDPRTLEPCNCVHYNPKEPDLKCQRCDHEHTEITTYKDLDKLPCILILQKRGRLGDTFPRSFNCMDLRICYTNEVRSHSYSELQ